MSIKYIYKTQNTKTTFTIKYQGQPVQKVLMSKVQAVKDPNLPFNTTQGEVL